MENKHCNQSEFLSMPRTFSFLLTHYTLDGMCSLETGLMMGIALLNLEFLYITIIHSALHTFYPKVVLPFLFPLNHIFIIQP